jgi:hypothetical protein
LSSEIIVLATAAHTSFSGIHPDFHLQDFPVQKNIGGIIKDL